MFNAKQIRKAFCLRQCFSHVVEKQFSHPIAFAMIHILTTTGLRNEEFCNLKVGDLQYDSINGGTI